MVSITTGSNIGIRVLYMCTFSSPKIDRKVGNLDISSKYLQKKTSWKHFFYLGMAVSCKAVNHELLWVVESQKLGGKHIQTSLEGRCKNQ